MDIINFGSTKPEITTFHGGYRVPVGLQQVDITAGDNGVAGKGWSGYLLELAGLSAVEFDRVAGALPPGDYSADRLSVLTEAVSLKRKANYPPIEEYLDAVVKDDALQLAAYKAKCLEVKAAHPLPWDSKASYRVGDLVSHDGRRWKATSDSSGNEPDDVPGDWVVD